MINIRKLEAELWESADLLRQGSKQTSNQYCMPVLALLFLRYAYSRYKLVEQKTRLPFYEFIFGEHIQNVRIEIDAYMKS